MGKESALSTLPSELQFKVLQYAVGSYHGRPGVLDQKTYAALRLTSRSCRELLNAKETWKNQVRLRLRGLALISKYDFPLTSIRLQGSTLSSTVLSYLNLFDSLKDLELAFFQRDPLLDFAILSRNVRLRGLAFTGHLYPVHLNVPLNSEDLKKIAKLPIKRLVLPSESLISSAKLEILQTMPLQSLSLNEIVGLQERDIRIFQNMPLLRTLHLGVSGVSPWAVKALRGLTNLETFVLDQPLSEDLISAISNLHNLRRLSVVVRPKNLANLDALLHLEHLVRLHVRVGLTLKDHVGYFDSSIIIFNKKFASFLKSAKLKLEFCVLEAVR
ncbi:MAG: hypothetical protein ACK5O7_03760 [Holosporales bacterium]